MRVTLAAVACLAALVRADTASAYAGADGPRPVVASICAEPARVVEVSLPGDAIGGERVERADRKQLDDRVEGGERVERGTRADLNEQGAPTLWCVSPDDPRCAPLETSGHDGMSFGSAKLSYTAADGLEPLKPRDVAAVSGETSHRGSPRDGFLGRLERPPNRSAA